MSDEFDTEEAFGKANKGLLRKGYDQLRDLIFDTFAMNEYLSDEENKAITKDMLQTNTGVKYDNLVEVWYKLWKMGGKKKRVTHEDTKGE